MAKKRGPKPKAKPVKKDSAYERRKAEAGARLRLIALEGREIGELGYVADPKRRLKASRDFAFYAKTYHPERFPLDWSPDHLKVIAHVEEAVLHGGLFAVAMARGDGKTSIAQTAAEWAALNGHREFAAIIGATLNLAKKIVESIRVGFECSPLLLEDYPEVMVPVRALQGIANRCKGQMYQGQRTHVAWSADQLVLPDLSPDGWARRRDHAAFLRPDGRSLSSGCVIRAAGLTGAVRGMMHTRPDGSTIRPSLVIPDDPQTDRSARSLSQCEERERLLAGAVLKMCGPGVKMSGVMPCTVIRPGDVADSLLDRSKHPEWNGVRTRMLYEFPRAMDLWNRYRDLRGDGLRAGDGGRAATEFYREHRIAMDEGAAVSWPQRHNPDELSALQHAMNHFFTDEGSFWSEYQNEPRRPDADPSELTAAEIASKLSGHERGLVPRYCTKLTAFADSHADLIYWCVCGWGEGYTGAVIDYGTFPDQRRTYFSLADAQHTLQRAFPKGGVEQAVYAGLEATAEMLCGNPWPLDGGGELRIERLLVDANWGQMTDKIYLWARQSKWRTLILPSHGRYVGASSLPLNSTPKKDPQERRGTGWYIPGTSPRPVRGVQFDSNLFKSFVVERLKVPMGGKGCLSLFGDDPRTHRLFADHLTAEYRVPVEGRGRKCDEWKWRPGRPDNHWLDTLVGCCVAAAVQGVSLMGEPTGQAPAPRPRVSFAELQRQKQLTRA